MKIYLAAACAMLMLPSHLLAQISAEEANKSNNPLNPAIGVSFQDYYTTGIGDLNLFDIFLLAKTGGGVQLSAGPLIMLPTASDDMLGMGKYWGSLAAIAVHPAPLDVIGGLPQWQASFAGDRNRADVSTLTAQLLYILKIPDGWYLG